MLIPVISLLASIVTLAVALWVLVIARHVSKKVDKIMDDVNELSGVLDAVANDVATVLQHSTELTTEVQQLQAQLAQVGNPVDLSGVLAKARAIQATLENVQSNLPSGNDTTSGGNGADTLSGGNGADTLSGGTASSDTGDNGPPPGP